MSSVRRIHDEFSAGVIVQQGLSIDCMMFFMCSSVALFSVQGKVGKSCMGGIVLGFVPQEGLFPELGGQGRIRDTTRRDVPEMRRADRCEKDTNGIMIEWESTTSEGGPSADSAALCG